MLCSLCPDTPGQRAVADPPSRSTRGGAKLGAMAAFEPFTAVRYADDRDLAAVVAPPYDVLSRADVRELAARDPHNIVHLDVPEQTEAGYDAASTALRRWLADGVLQADDAPSYTIYRMRFRDAGGQPRDLAGVLGALEVVGPDEGRVLPHERTTPKASTDRYDLTLATSANLSPVWGLSLAHGLTELLREPGEPVGAVTVDDVEHRVERLTDPERIRAIGELIGSDDVLIADGHHRYGVARRYREAMRGTALEQPATRTLAYVGELVADQLSIEAIHRVYRGLDHDSMRHRLAEFFDIVPHGPVVPGVLAEMQARGRLLLIGPRGESEWLLPKPAAFAGVRDLDGARLEHALDGVPVEVSYQAGVPEVLATIADGGADCAVLIRPVGIAEIERTAREGALMPPKSTFFTPKLVTGLVIRDLTRP